MGKTIMIVSGKGGCGTTTFTTNLATVLANTGSEVLVCDMNIGLRNDDIYLGMENKVLFDLADVMEGVCSLEKAIIKSDNTENLFLLSSPQCKNVSGLDAKNISALFDVLSEKYDYVFIDCPVSVGKMLEYIAEKSDAALLVLTADCVSLRNSDAVSRRLEKAGLKNRFYVLNKISENDLSHDPGLDCISQTMGIPIAGIIPYDEEIHFCNNKGVPISESGAAYYIKAFIEIAARIVA